MTTPINDMGSKKNKKIVAYTNHQEDYYSIDIIKYITFISTPTLQSDP